MIDPSNDLAIDEARRALRFAAHQRMKQWKENSSTPQSTSGTSMLKSNGFLPQGKKTPRTTSEVKKMQEQEVDTRRLERRIRERESAATGLVGSRAGTPGSTSSVSMTSAIAKLTHPTEATLSRARAVRSTLIGTSKTPSRTVSPAVNVRSRAAPSSGVSSHNSSMALDNGSTTTTTLAANTSCSLAIQGSVTIDDEMTLLKARMRFLEERKRDEEAARRARERAYLEAARPASGASRAEPLAVYDGGMVKDPITGRTYQRLFSFRLHEAGDDSTQRSEWGEEPQGSARAHSSTRRPSSAGQAPGGVTQRPSIVHAASTLCADSPLKASTQADLDDDSRLSLSIRQPSAGSLGQMCSSSPAGSVPPPLASATLAPSNDEDGTSPSSPTAKWISDTSGHIPSQRRRRGGAHPLDPDLQQEHSRTGSGEQQIDSLPESPRKENPVCVEPASSETFTWAMVSDNHAAAQSAAAASPSARGVSPDLMSTSDAALPRGGTPTTHPESFGYALPPVMHSSPARARRSSVGFTDAASPHSQTNPQAMRPVLSTAVLQQQQRSIAEASATSNAKPISGERTPQRVEPTPFLEPDASFYVSKGRHQEGGVLGATSSQARLILAASEAADDVGGKNKPGLTKEEWDQVAQWVIPAEVESSFQLMDDKQKRQLVRRYSTTALKKLKSNAKLPANSL